MSHYTVVRSKITRKSALIKALQNMGFKSHMIEDLKEAQALRGYRGDTRTQKAHIRIKGSGWGSSNNYVGGASNDLGWELMNDGSYAFHVSDYDRGKYNQKWQTKLLNEYSREVVKEECQAQNFFLAEETEETDGTIVMRLTRPF